ncbi:hypothetical protein BGZ80_001058 [Entomortierella chlamydospora]|uniref:AIG1-type G domain-containing protein n=1 Tax=Entomortierella chlamydospora TaxID=101097 RepID=A0A9P6SY02_9FUNG|nr:hypothetical protein BGZ79_002979 [Entomortierella chlamydospora]KAG0010949.1 hypothetical protein BGZ80_001058 [Entomortierella chlamydospora]
MYTGQNHSPRHQASQNQYPHQQTQPQQQQQQQPYQQGYQQQQQQQRPQSSQQPSQEQQEQSTPLREFTIVALGKSGEGKSTLLNAILGREMFLAKASVSEVTQHVDKATNHFLNIPSNPVMHCIDTPSFNGKMHDPNRVNEIGVLLTKVAAGVDAFLFVVKCTRYRYDNTFHQTLQTYHTLLTPAFWSKLIIVFTHATPELLPAAQSRVPLMAWAREIQDNFKLPSPPMVVFAMDYIRFPYPSGGAQDFWERLMELDANTEPYCHKPFLESFGNGFSVDGYVSRIKGHLAVFEPSFFEDQAEGQYKEQKELKKRKESRFNLFRKSTNATAK